jgi:cold shock protein
LQGCVKWFDINRGYGFITAQDGNEYFVHYSAIEGEGFKLLTKDNDVEFDVEMLVDGKTKAVNVKEIN